jgi:hypothetical protein
MRGGDHDNLVELLLVETTPQGLPRAGALRLRVRVAWPHSATAAGEA